MPRILLTDGETRTALACVRALGRSGHHVVVGSPSQPCLAGVSRYAANSVVLPDPLDAPSSYLTRVADVARQLGAQVILPVTDASMRALLAPGEPRLGDAALAAPSRTAYEALSDKGGLLARAPAVGLPVPRSCLASNPAELRLRADELGYPCVLKPHRSVVAEGGAQRKLGVRYALGPDDLRDGFPEPAFPVLVQELVSGVGEGVFLLLNRGRRIAAFAHRRLREKPPSGGVSVYRESIPLPADLLAPCEQLLREAEWDGVAMIEFKRSSREGTPFLMEVNGRLWGSLQLAIDAGVDFPGLLVRRTLGERVEPVDSYRVGVRSRWFWGDVDHLIARLRHSRRTLLLGPEAPSLPRAALEFLRFGRAGDRLEVLDRDDPRPFLHETLNWCRGRGT